VSGSGRRDLAGARASGARQSRLTLPSGPVRGGRSRHWVGPGSRGGAEAIPIVFAVAVGIATAAIATGCGSAPVAPVAAAPAPGTGAPPEPGAVFGTACVPTGIERCFDARDDNCNGLIDEGCGLPTGPVQFVIAWDESEVDVDLIVTGPDGELAEVGRATSSGLVKERDCPGRRRECAGQNLENVLLEDSTAPRGRYDVRIRLEHLGPATPPIRVTLGARVGPKTYAVEIELDREEAERRFSFNL
jgi:hypothetical protein